MKRFFLLFIGILMVYAAFSQKTTISGVVRDGQTMETLIGANVIVGAGVGTITDFDGRFMLEVSPGEYELKVSYVGYLEYSKKVTVGNKSLTFDIKLETLVLDEVSVVADVARARQTPIAFTNVLPAKIEEQLAGQDIPMVLNSTPGVYATQQGGGDGDARITIRGFDQRNVGVLLDGVPVNDMENGWVYWSNWFGLDAVTRSMQVQRGLGASKLALPSVGGTVNIITKGFDTKREAKISEEIDWEGKTKTTIGFNSGKLKHGFAFTGAGSYKRGNTYIEQTRSEGWFYYLKLDKRTGNHITSIMAMGAPQWHDQRSYKKPIATYSAQMAKDLDVVLTGKRNASSPERNIYPIYDMGIDYNQHWGYVKRDKEVWNADTTARILDANADREVLNETRNFYHKPQYSIRDFWNVNDKLAISNVLYMSKGNGGGTGLGVSLKDYVHVSDWVLDTTKDDYGQINWQYFYNLNILGGGPFSPPPHNHHPKLLEAVNYVMSSNNEHIWYGYVGTATYKLNPNYTFSGGLDLRSYKGIHYRQIIDLLGADFVWDQNDNRVPDNDPSNMKKVGDKVDYYYDGLVRWGGAFGQLEYSGGLFSAFVNITGAISKYKLVHYFQDKSTPWKSIPGGTIKGGVNYNLSEKMNLFCNLGYLSKARDFRYIFPNYNPKFSNNLDNERVKALEVGYTYTSQIFSANLNTYITRWENKPSLSVRYGDEGTGEIPGMDALHKGIELDCIYKPLRNLEIQGLVSLGDWKWDKKVDDVIIYSVANSSVILDTISIDARDIHVSMAAQTQFGGSVRYEIIKDLYVMGKVTYFSKNFSEFSPEQTIDPATGKSRDSWEMPAYTIFDFHAGYKWSFKHFEKTRFSFKINVLNIFDKIYIVDGKNNDSYHPAAGYITSKGVIGSTFDANSATVFFGPPRRITTSFEITF